MNTPWGKSNYTEKVCPGITFFSTASHGGYHVSKRLNKLIPAKWKLSGRYEQWYEEDCGWAPLAATFPQHFPKITEADLARTIPMWEDWVNFR